MAGEKGIRAVCPGKRKKYPAILQIDLSEYRIRRRVIPGHHAQTAGQTTAIGQPAKCTKLRAVHIHLTMEKQKEKICKPEPAYTNGKQGCHGA